MKITALQILAAIKLADAEKHGSAQIGWLEADDLRDVGIDGRIDLVRVAEILSEVDDLAKTEVNSDYMCPCQNKPPRDLEAEREDFERMLSRVPKAAQEYTSGKLKSK